MNADSESRLGGFYAGLSFFWWGVIPIYFQYVRHISATELIGHRVVGVTLIALVLLAALRLLPAVQGAIRDRRILQRLMLSASMICINWLVFTWAATNDRLLETSMGYFINPLFSVLLGVVLLRERLRPWQVVSVTLAAVGVLQLVVNHGSLPWIALVLPFTFGLYGLIRKQTPVHALAGLFIETLLMSPFALLYLVWLGASGNDHVIHGDWPYDGLVFLAGPLTLVPLALFSAGAKRITLTTVGFLQYIAPSMTFLLAVFVYQEPFDGVELITFICIWVSLVIFSVDSLRTGRVAAQKIVEEGA